MLVIEGLAVALVAYVYAVILTEPGMILNAWFNFLDIKLGRRNHWLFKPLIGCFKCVAGQMALWYYLFTYYQHYNLLHHIFIICLSIQASILINKLNTWNQH
jgi:hypothetical protein